MVTSRRMGTDKQQRESEGPLLTDKAWNRVRHNGHLVRDEVTGWLAAYAAYRGLAAVPADADGPPCLRAPVALGATGRHRGSIVAALAALPVAVCSTTSHRWPTGKGPRRPMASYVSGTPWLLPILAGRARDLAVRPEAHGSEQGRRMRRIKGGIHVQRRYREQGWHPLPSVRKAWGLIANRPALGIARPTSGLLSDSKL
jgi:hypothetical protein